MICEHCKGTRVVELSGMTHLCSFCKGEGAVPDTEAHKLPETYHTAFMPTEDMCVHGRHVHEMSKKDLLSVIGFLVKFSKCGSFVNGYPFRL